MKNKKCNKRNKEKKEMTNNVTENVTKRGKPTMLHRKKQKKGKTET